MTNHKSKRTDKKAKKLRDAPQKKKQAETSSFNVGCTNFRLFAFQPLSITIEDPKPFNLSIQKIDCRIMLRPVHVDEAEQRTHGGTIIAIDYSLNNETDPLLSTKIGLDLINDFLAGVSLVEGVTFRDVEPVQIVCSNSSIPGEYTLIHFLGLSVQHWDKAISHDTVKAVRKLLAHWDGLDTGRRLRRAARQFHKAIGTDDILSSFQHAYMGLEALEKPLADAIGIPPGAEVIIGNCTKCGAEYKRFRTTLAGVRAYLLGSIHPEKAMDERRQEWRRINDLRQDLFHSLEDIVKLEEKASTVAIAVMHFLHDAICCLSHSHDLESPSFKLIRGIRQIVFIGKFCCGGHNPIEECHPLFEVEGACWVSHAQYGFVPEFRIVNRGIKDLGGIFYWLNAPIGKASMKDLIPANWENKTTDL